MHNNAPAFCWDPEHAPESQVLEKHPKLRLAIAHMGYYYEDIPRAAALLDKYPNLHLDMTPAVDVYENLSLKATEAEAFIRKYCFKL